MIDGRTCCGVKVTSHPFARRHYRRSPGCGLCTSCATARVTAHVLAHRPVRSGLEGIFPFISEVFADRCPPLPPEPKSKQAVEIDRLSGAGAAEVVTCAARQVSRGRVGTGILRTGVALVLRRPAPACAAASGFEPECLGAASRKAGDRDQTACSGATGHETLFAWRKETEQRPCLGRI